MKKIYILINEDGFPQFTLAAYSKRKLALSALADAKARGCVGYRIETVEVLK